MDLRSEFVNVDRTQTIIVQGMQLPWVNSPVSGVQRRMLARIGEEVAFATSIVRYAPQSRFTSHMHELGEEFLVLEGTFADEHGSYPAGTYVRNPPGSSHTPFSAEGCTIFVKLRHMRRGDNCAIRLLPQEQLWTTIGAGIHRSLLYSAESSHVELVRMKAGRKLPVRTSQHGEELFVIRGNVRWCDKSPVLLNQWDWVRSLGDDHCTLVCDDDTLLWVKRGHLRPGE